MLPNCCRKYGYVTLHCKDVHPRRIREDTRRQSPSNRHVTASISISVTTCLCLVSSTAILFPMVMVTLSFGSDVLARIRSCNWSNDVIFPPTPGSGNHTFMFLQICRNTATGPFGFGRFEHTVTAYYHLPAIPRKRLPCDCIRP